MFCRQANWNIKITNVWPGCPFLKLFNSNSGSQSLPSTHESNGTITAVSALQVIKEYRDRESHKLSVILHNIPESDSTETSARISHDTKIAADIADKICIGLADAFTTMRLGEKNAKKISTFEGPPFNLQHKLLLLSNAKKLKDLSENFQKIYITPKRKTGE